MMLDAMCEPLDGITSSFFDTSITPTVGWLSDTTWNCRKLVKSVTSNSSVFVQYGCGFSNPKEWINYDNSPSILVQRIPVFGSLIKKILRTSFPDNIKYGDIIKGLPVQPDSCDAVYCSHTLEHLSLENCRKAIKNTRKILKEGGVFRCVVPSTVS